MSALLSHCFYKLKISNFWARRERSTSTTFPKLSSPRAHYDHTKSATWAPQNVLESKFHTGTLEASTSFCPQQKKEFYLAITRNLFEHCVQVWRPSSDTSMVKLERIQKRAVKWILSEQFFSYNDVKYLARLQDINLVPIKYRFIFSDSLLFHKIF